jgi:hypothetical protein
MNVRPSRSGDAKPNSDDDASATELRPVRLSGQFFGMHTLSPARHWPSVPLGAMRPAGVTWGALEPSKGQYDWGSLDFWLQQTQLHGVEFDYVFLNVPQWTSARPDEACAGKRVGCAAPPKLEDWDNFVRALSRGIRAASPATRCERAQRLRLLERRPKTDGGTRGSRVLIIKSIDPAAIVTTPAASTGWPWRMMRGWIVPGRGRRQSADVVAWHGYSGQTTALLCLPKNCLTRFVPCARFSTDTTWARCYLNTEGGWKERSAPR